MEFQLTPEMLDLIDQYIKGNLDGEKLNSFKRDLEVNPALKEEVLIQQQLFQAIENQKKPVDEDIELQEKLKNPEYQKLSNTIRKVGTEFIENPSVKNRIPWIRFRRFIPYAAAILVTVIISTIYLNNNHQSIDQYYYDYVDWNAELVSFTEKSDTKNDFALGESYFRSKDYYKAIRIFRSINPNNRLYPYSLMYLGAAHANVNQDHLAIETFELLSQQNEFGESSKGLWYTALIYLKVKDSANAREALELISKDPSNYKYEDAVKIMKKLD
ncbi:MAG: hypothetical protein AAGA77_14150 [Bacteroidota bacterium]